MKQDLLRMVGRFLTGLVALSFVGFLLFLAIQSFPKSTANNSTYPGPVEIIITPSVISPEALCEKWFSYRKQLTEDKRAIVEEDYKNCVNARTTPSPAGVSKSKPSMPSDGLYTTASYIRSAGSGKIIETSFTPLNSIYRIKNQWHEDINGLHITVYAGGRQSDSAGGDALLSDLSWPGILVLTVTDGNGNYLAEKSGEYWTPRNAGPVRVVSANGDKLTLVAVDGTSFIFDVVNRQFLSTVMNNLISRSAGAGMLVESGNTPFSISDYDFVNYWYYDKKGLGRITIMAGNQHTDPKSGVLVFIVSSTDKSKIVQGFVYPTLLSDGALRIVNVEGEKLNLVSDNDLIYEFDAALQRFVSLPFGSDTISAVPLQLNVASTVEPGLLLVVTPTKTPTPRPTRTSLPTYNPYP